MQLSLFDKKNLAEIHSPDYPDERGRKRKELLAATEKEFERIQAELARRKRTPLPAAEIGRKVGRVLDRYKMGKHFETTIAGGVFQLGAAHRGDQAGSGAGRPLRDPQQ